MNCPKCAAPAEGDSHFCEECGARLQPTTQESVVVAPPRDPAIAARDHFETALAPHFAAVTDRGIRHNINEDSFAIARFEQDGVTRLVIAVCDGVSSAIHAEVASLAAAQTAQSIIIEALGRGETPEAALGEAISAAHRAVCALPYSRSLLTSLSKSPPASTIVAAVVTGKIAVIGWVGDSRAYWLVGESKGGDPGESKMLTHDHSWVNDMVDGGQMSLEAALQSRNAHAITQCLGPLEANDPGEPPEPSFTTFEIPDVPGMLLLCTDGLWNYADDPATLAALAGQIDAGGASGEAEPAAHALQVARHLVQFAVQQGGRDNITASVVLFPTETDR